MQAAIPKLQQAVAPQPYTTFQANLQLSIRLYEKGNLHKRNEIYILHLHFHYSQSQIKNDFL